MRRHVLCLLVSLACAAAVAAAELRPIPPLTADLSGQFSLPKIPGLPPLAWRVHARPAAGHSLAFDATATAPGLELRLEFTLPGGESPGTWRLVRA
mgnify:FL=1